jgi:hypothetical protein
MSTNSLENDSCSKIVGEMDFYQLCDGCQQLEAKHISAEGAEAADQTRREAQWRN